MSKEKQIISQDEHLKLLGLGVLAERCRDEQTRIERAIAGLLGIEDVHGGYFEHVSDAMFDDNPVAYIIDAYNLEVAD